MIDKISDFSDWMVGFRGVFCGFSGEPVRKVPHQPVPPLPKPCRRQIVIRNSDFSDRLGGVIFAGFSLWVKGLLLILVAVFGFMNCLI